MVEKHFVTFVSPGTMVPETSTYEVDSWDVERAKEMSKSVSERYGATPYSFHFTTRRNDGELDSKETNRSCRYFLGGVVLTLAEVKARNNKGDAILISNMEMNGIARVVQNDNSWRATIPFNDDDVLLDV